MSQKLYISGMTCRSCEVLIERELKTLDGVSKIEVSHQNGTLEIEGNRKYSSEEIGEKLKEHGYALSSSPHSAPKKSVDWKRVGGWLIVIFALYMVLNRLGLLVFSPKGGDPQSLIGVLIIGLVASVSSCTAVVGGLVVAVSSHMARAQSSMSSIARMKPHLFFHVGRIIGFAFFGALVGLLGKTVQLSPTMNGVFVLAIALLMIMLAVNLLDLFPAYSIGMPKWLAHKIYALSESNNPRAPFMLGAFTFFLPCGFTQSMQLYALSLQNPWQASVVMTVFALGTLPALMGVGTITAFSKGKTLNRITKFAGVLVMVLGISNIANGAALLGFSGDVVFADAQTTVAPSVGNGKQYIQMEITDDFSYAPDILRVQKDIPVVWEISAGKYLGCASTLVSPALGINTSIRTGLNTVKFTPKRAGVFTFSCSMGMIRGTMIVTN